ncbi:MAG TPA: excinuclease ABC subunit UvrC [Terriglobia bacterium]|nr:excinuclease ABC subunit UvrC [Terriglobia bacterium]
MTLREKSEAAPLRPGVYIFKDDTGKAIYVGKAKSLRLRLRSYFQDSRTPDVKRDLMLEAASDLETILVDNEKEALALENNLIKRYQPRYNILLRDDKSFPHIKLTLGERWPRVYVTRRLRKDGSLYFGPYFPANLAYRVVDFIHRSFRVPSCKVDLTRFHPRPCLEYHIKRCVGPCVEGFTTDEAYGEAVRHVRMLLEGRVNELLRDLREVMAAAAENQRYEEAARYRDQITTLEQLRERQKMEATEGHDADYFGFHQEGPLVAVNLFHVRGGRVADRREFFWEDVEAFEPAAFFSSLIKQLYLDQPYLPHSIHVPVDFEDRELLEEVLSEKRGRRVSIAVPQRGAKHALVELVARNAIHSFTRRFRMVNPPAREMAQQLAEALELERAPQRIECFDISHIQGSDVVASMVVWEAGKMKKSDYRKFIVRNSPANDDFASMREVVGRRYRRLQEEQETLPDVILIDGGLGQLHAAAEALESLGIINQPMAAIAKKEEILFVLGHEDEPIALDHHSPALHLVQQIRDEAHRFAVTFHRARRSGRELTSELLKIPGVGEKTARKLLSQFGSVTALKGLSAEELSQVVRPTEAKTIREYLNSV